MIAPLPDDETQRLEALRRFDILDTPPEQAFDDLTRLASQICGTPIALVTLVDESRHWFKSKVGLDLSETPRDAAFCEYAIAGQDLCVVGDARADERFATNPSVVSEPYIRFYAGMPLRTPEGFALGTLCVLDTVPRELTQVQADALRTLGRQVMAQLELRRHLASRDRDVASAAEALRHEGALRDRFMESATDAMVALDLEGRFTLVNRRACEMAGRSEDELLGTWFTDLVPPDAVAGVAAEFSRVTTEHVSIEGYETDVVRPDGSVVRVAFNIGPLLQDGRLIGAAATAEDITERSRAEEALRESEARYRALAENAFDLVCELDSEGRLVYASPNFKAVLGYEAPDLIGQVAFALIHPEDQARVGQEYAKAIADPVPGTITFRLRRDDETWIWLEASAKVFRNDAGESHAVIVARDIGQRMAMEATLRDSEALYRDLIENANDIVYTHDLQGNFTSVNAAGLRTYGLKAEDIGSVNIRDIVHPGSLPVAVEKIRSKLSGEVERTAAYELLTQARDGTLVWVEVSTRVLRVDGRPAGVHGIARDITQRKRAEEALRESEERLRSFVRSAPLILFGTDRGGVYTLFEGKGLERVGLQSGEYLGHSIFDVHADQPQILHGALRALAGEAITYLFRGKRVSFEVHHAPVRDAAGEITGTIGVVIDVSERMRAEEALRKSEERYRGIFETHGAAWFLVDPATGLLEEANQAACVFYGYSAEEMAGKRISEINILPHEEILEEMRRAREENQNHFQFQHRLKSGEVRDVDVYTGPVEVEGRTLLFSVVQDVTERRRAESLLTSQRQLLEMTAVRAPLEDVLERLTRFVEEYAEGALCSVLLLTADGTQLRHAAAPSLPDVYNQSVNGLVIGPEAGSCGTAAYLRREVVVEDIASDPLWAQFRHLALPHGLRSCWSTPIFSSAGEVLGTFAVYYRETGGVREQDRTLVGIATYVAGIAIERKRGEDAVRRRTAELERMYRRLSAAHAELEGSKAHLEEKSLLLERALELERERSRRDQLTGTLNHAAIADVLREMISDEGTQTLAIAMVDVDGLKAANDTYGHQVGDAVLVMIAQKLMRAGAAVGRYGGDEFVAILRGADRKAAEEYRDEVLASLVGAGLTDAQTGAHVPIVASIGLAVYPEEAEAVDDLIRLSDSAMYASRRHRVAESGDDILSRSLGGDRAAKMVGEIVPLLTSPGALNDKLRLVGHRLSVGAGYDGVSFVMDGRGEADPALSAFARMPEARLQEWNQLRRNADAGPIDEVLRRTMRPVIIDDLETTELFTDVRRRILVGAGLHSALIAPMIWEDQMIGALSVASKQRNAFTVRDAEFVGAVATQVTAIVRMSSLVEQLQASTSQLQQAHEGTVLMLASAAEAHDHTTGRHLERVRAISEAIARDLGYDDEAVSALGVAATLHDIGKIRVPDSVLGSSNSLAEAEWVLMKQHTLWGAAFLSGQPGFELAASVARHHHERWDGAGYPDGLSLDEIPEAALITTVADSFDAMTNNRPYRRGRPVEDAVREIVACSGTQFSPRVVDALVRLFERGDLDFVRPDEDELAA